MGFNKDFNVPRTTVQWDDQDVCTVRGITPRDIAKVVAENGGDVELLLQTWEKDESLRSIDAGDSEAVTAAIQANSGKLFNTILSSVPDLVAKLIAEAAEEPDHWLVVRDQYVLPLQLDILKEVARLTFVNPDKFQEFLGNVLGLVGSVGNQMPSSLPAPSQPTH
jgi:hypothetical protein